MDGQFHDVGIYLGGTITGLSYAEAVARRNEIAEPLVELGFPIHSPMRGKRRYLSAEKKIASGGYAFPMSSDRAIFDRDHWDVVHRSTILIFDFLDATEKSLGSIMEIAWGAEYRKFIILIMEPGNIHDHAFVRAAATVIVKTREEAVKLVMEWAGIDV